MTAPDEPSPETVPLAVSMGRPAWRDTFAALVVHNYRLYVLAQFVANTAGWAQRIAVDWLVLEITGSVGLVGVTIALQFLPTLVLGAYAGVIADRFPKRAVLLVCQSSIALLSGLLAVLAITGHSPLWAVYVLVLLIGSLQVIDSPARSVFINEMVGPDRLRNAISLNASIFHLGALLGPAISGVLIVAVGSGWAIALNAVAVVIGVIVLLSMRRSELVVAPRRARAKGEIREALRYVRSKPTLFWTLVMVAFVATFGITMPAILAGMASVVYNTGATGYGLYNSLISIGALLGALASTRRGVIRLRTIILGALVYGVLQLLAGAAPIYLLFLVLLPTIGLSRLLYMTAGETMVQLSSNLAIRGRIMALWVQIVVGGQAIGGPLMGFLTEHLGARVAMMVSGGVPAVAAIVIAVLLARRGQLRLAFRIRRGLWLTVEPRRQTAL